MVQSKVFFDPERLYEEKIAKRECMTYDDLTVEQSAELDDVLMIWFEWQRAFKEKLGVPSRSSFAMASCDVEHLQETYIAQQVDLEIDVLPIENRIALNICLMNKSLGIHVFRHPRYSPDVLMKNYRTAKQMLYVPLKRRDVLEK